LEGSGGVLKDEAKAVQLFRQAAGMGHAESQYELAACHYHGRGVTVVLEAGKQKDQGKQSKEN